MTVIKPGDLLHFGYLTDSNTVRDLVQYTSDTKIIGDYTIFITCLVLNVTHRKYGNLSLNDRYVIWYNQLISTRYSIVDRLKSKSKIYLEVRNIQRISASVCIYNNIVVVYAS